MMTRDWEEIVLIYEDLRSKGVAVDQMVQLSRRICRTRLATALHGWTSMHDLFVTQYPVAYPYDGPRLLIAPRFNGTTEFRYVDTSERASQWRRTAADSEVWALLLGFLSQLSWLSKAELCDLGTVPTNIAAENRP
jgi:hypothetical protein